MSCKTTAVIVTYNSDDTIAANLTAFKTAHDAGLISVIVVDNDSQDETATLVRRDFPWAQLIESRTNLGYGRGLNLGFDHVDTPYVIFMNPDAVLPCEALKVLLDFMEAHPQAGMIGPSILRRNGAYQEAGGLLKPSAILRSAAGFSGNPPHRKSIQPDAAPFETDWLCGALLFARTELIRKIGAFDPRFFLYFEETDLCVRVRAAGAQLWAVGQANAFHASNASARKVRPELETGGCLEEHFYASRFYYLWKHHGVLSALLAESGEVLLLGVRDAVRTVLRRGNRGEALRNRLKGPLFAVPKKVL